MLYTMTNERGINVFSLLFVYDSHSCVSITEYFVFN